MLLDAKTLALALEEMAATDAAALSLDLLSPAQIKALTAAAKALSFRAGKPQIGSGDKAVYQDFLLTADWPVGSPFLTLEQELEQLLQETKSLISTPLLPAGFTFNDHMALYYPAGSKGITPHRDMTRFAGIILLITLSGKATFLTSDDRLGNLNAQTYDLSAGKLVLLRGTEFGAFDKDGGRAFATAPDRRPFHAVTEVSEARYCLGYRYDREL